MKNVVLASMCAAACFLPASTAFSATGCAHLTKTFLRTSSPAQRPNHYPVCSDLRRTAPLASTKSGTTGESERLTATSTATTTALSPDHRGSLHFINLSNGVEALPLLRGLPVSFIRIQSSHCESNNFSGILGGLDSTFLMYLAMGHDCYIYDFGSRNKKRKAPRAVWYGITFIKYALHKMWELPGEPPTPILRGHNAAAAFDKAIKFLDKAVKKKIKYYKNYVSTSQLSIYGVVGATEIDGRRDLHSHLAFEYASVRHMACVPMLNFSVCFPC